MNLKPYPEYKDSGVEWIGEIPKGWEIKRIKHICSESAVYGLNESSENYQEDGIRFIRTTDIDESGNLDKRVNGVFIPKERTIGYILHTGDILVSRSGSLGTSLFFDKEKYGDCSYAGYLVKFRTNNFNLPRFLFYFTKSEMFNYQIQLEAVSSTISNFNGQKYANMKLFTPSLSEQQKISSFLDKKTSEIDLTIEKDSRLIELLREKRTALINHVVTKGLDPMVRMKDSGVEWIGEIPEDWKLKRLKYNVLVNPPGKKSISDPKSKINFLPMEKVSEDGSYDLDSKTEYEKVCSGYTYFEDNDVLLAKITPCFENGKGTLVENLDYGFGFGTTEFHVFRSSNEIIPKYLYFLTKSHLFRVTGEAFMEGAAGQKRVSTDFVKNFRMPTPPDNQQYQIIEYLDQKTSEIDLTIQKIQEHIKLLVEYKKSLIHHVVTGKVDVREVAV